jgi:peptide deformylase
VILKVAALGHPVLRSIALAVPPEDILSPGVQGLIDSMLETMREYEGIGLAAPQVHQAKRIIVADLGNASEGSQEREAIALVNPEFVELSKETEEGWEGCLSVPGLRGKVARSIRARLRAYDRQGRRVEVEASGRLSRILQHETDHLDGTVFLDRMSGMRSLCFLGEFEKYQDA